MKFYEHPRPYGHHSHRPNLSYADRAALVASLKQDPTQWPSKVAAEWDIGLDHAKQLIAKAQEQYTAKSVL